MNNTAIKFARPGKPDFFRILTQRVNDYFREKEKSKYANGYMVFKTVTIILLYVVPYLLMITGVVTLPVLVWAMWALMGVGMAGIGLTIMHDASHGSYSNNKTFNRSLAYLMDFVGGNSDIWNIQHNNLHHTYTNVHHRDEDIAPGKVLRFSPHEPRFKHHTFQHIYVWLLYALTTLSWVTTKDFVRYAKFRKLGYIKKKEARNMLAVMIFGKLFYYTYTIVLPLIFLPFSVGFIILCFLTTHVIAGWLLAIVFQPAHVMPSCDYPLPDETGNLKNTWAVHQLYTTTNFAPTNRLFSWYAGGLNYQVEHHLFPHICHIHYKEIAPIVMETAKEFNLPYHTIPSVRGALWQHTLMLKDLGRPGAEVIEEEDNIIGNKERISAAS